MWVAALGMSGNGSNRWCIFTLSLPTHVFFPTILKSFSEKYEEKISGLSYTANVNRKTVDSNGIWTRTFKIGEEFKSSILKKYTAFITMHSFDEEIYPFNKHKYNYLQVEKILYRSHNVWCSIYVYVTVKFSSRSLGISSKMVCTWRKIFHTKRRLLLILFLQPVLSNLLQKHRL